MWYRTLQPRLCFTGIEAATLAAYAAAASAATGIGATVYQATNQPDQPQLPPTPQDAPPNPDDADTKARLAAAQSRERRRKSSSLLTNPGQPLTQAPVQVKSLLGQ